MVQRVEISEGTLRQENGVSLYYDILFPEMLIYYTWFVPLGSGSYRSVRVVRGFKELRDVFALMKIMFYFIHSSPQRHNWARNLLNLDHFVSIAIHSHVERGHFSHTSPLSPRLQTYQRNGLSTLLDNID